MKRASGILGLLALEQIGGIDAQAPHPRPDLGPFFLQEAASLGVAEPCAGARSDEHADTALDDDQALVLEALIGLGHRQRIGLLLGGERADRGKRIAVGVAAGEDCVGDRLAEADVNRFLVLFSYRHAVLIQRLAGKLNRLSSKCHRAGGCHGLAMVSSAGRSRSSSSREQWPMKINPAIRSPGPQRARRTWSE